MNYLVLNLKTYPQSSGENAARLAKAAGRAGAGVIVAPPIVDLAECARKSPVEIFSQHCDPLPAGKSTGGITLDALKEAGAGGTILNHSERKVPFEHCKAVCGRAKGLGLPVLLCADSVDEAVKLAPLRPWAIAVEPPQLIGTGRSVSAENPRIVVDAVKRIKAANPGVLVFVGAGVSTPDDCRKCVELGAQGVLLASAFVFSKKPALFARECLAAMN